MTTGDDAAGEPPVQERDDGPDGAAAGAADSVDAALPPEDRGPVTSLRSQDGVEVLALAGELDLDSVQDVAPVLDEALGTDPGRLVVDVSQVSFADSSALNLLLRTHTRTSLHLGGPLHPFVERLFEVTGILGVLNVHPSVDEAVRAAARCT